MPSKSKKPHSKTPKKTIVLAKLPASKRRQNVPFTRRRQETDNPVSGVNISLSLSSSTVQHLSRVLIILIILAALLYAPNAAALLASLKAAVELVKHLR